jgi:pimeloyl-ACP methyl ester carboxylesterase
LKGYFEIDNVTFSHHMASVNGIQLHYVIGDQGDPVILLHGWPQTAYSYAVAHLNNVSKLVIMDYIFAGFLPPEFGQNGPSRFAFHQVPNLPETLVQGKEREYLSWFYKGLAYNPDAITQGDIDEFVNYYSAPGGMRAGFEYYRAVFEDAEQNKDYAKEKLEILILTIGGEVAIGNYTTTSFQKVANNVTGITLPNTGHFIPEERPNFLTKQVLDFFK